MRNAPNMSNKMPISDNQLPADVRNALQQGNAIEAIKLLRQSTGLGLKEAKDAIDAHLLGRSTTITPAASMIAFPPSVVDALSRGNKIEAIKLLREHTGLGLKEAKDAVDAYQQGSSTSTEGLSPGQVSRSGSAIGWLAVIAACIAAYYFLRGFG